MNNGVGGPEPVEGEIFRRNYLRPSSPSSDSARARRRLLQIVWGGHDTERSKLVSLVQAELGVSYPYGTYNYDHTAFWERSEVGDFLSTITLWHRVIGYPARQESFRSAVGRIFSEENLRYRIDDKGGIHFLVDEEFERTVASAIEGLGAPRFAASHHALLEGMSALGTDKQSGKALIRGVFEAVESAFLVVTAQPSGGILNAMALERHLKPLLLERYSSCGDAGDMVERLLDHFKAWVKSAHPFRHGTPLEQIHEAPLDLAIMSATQGMGYLRLLASL